MAVQALGAGVANVAVAAKGHSAGAKGGETSKSGSTDVTSTVTTANPDGSTTTITTYANGTTSTTSTPPVASASGSNNLLDGGNSGQLSTLLAAQERAKSA